jgi:hypothetical protein
MNEGRDACFCSLGHIGVTRIGLKNASMIAGYESGTKMSTISRPKNLFAPTTVQKRKKFCLKKIFADECEKFLKKTFSSRLQAV